MTLARRLAPLVRHASIRRKLIVIVAVTCGIAIFAAGAAVFAFQTFTLRATFQRDIVALTDIVAGNLSGTIAFADRKAALEVLDSLKAKPQIIAADVRTRNGERFVALGAAPTEPDVSAEETRSHFNGWTLHAAAPIAVDGERSGTLHLAADFRSTFLDSLSLFLMVFTAICSGALAVAVAIGYRLQDLITLPVVRLSEAARQIGARHDYNVRVQKMGRDELGVLTDAFNGMLERLQAGDAKLRQANAALTYEIDQRRRLQSELLESSRLAGMAEVATGVLHNVGNVLNSVNVSAGLMREQLQASRLVTLRRTVELLQTHEHDLAQFLTQDEKGRRIPPFIARIAEQLAAEQARFGAELTELARNVEHIKEIVAIQQTYAKASAVIELVDMGQLADQAISIHRTSLDRHGVQIERDYPSDLPPVATDRHKVLQVATNFVANAIHALKTNAPGQRRMTLALRCGSELTLSVTDNGEGIPAENLKKLFRQGFTTRKEGHGFGLHSGVLLMKALGGTLEAASPGPGQGATFTLRLPLAAGALAQAA